MTGSNKKIKITLGKFENISKEQFLNEINSHVDEFSNEKHKPSLLKIIPPLSPLDRYELLEKPLEQFLELSLNGYVVGGGTMISINIDQEFSEIHFRYEKSENSEYLLKNFLKGLIQTLNCRLFIDEQEIN